jgi:hypothetical protein
MDTCFAISAFWWLKNWHVYGALRERASREHRRLTFAGLGAGLIVLTVFGQGLIWFHPPQLRYTGLFMLALAAAAAAAMCVSEILWIRRLRSEGA